MITKKEQDLNVLRVIEVEEIDRGIRN
jgi:hypothetical protein